jgi:hypothetical protein
MGRNFGRGTRRLSLIESLEGRTLLSGYTASLVAPVPTRTDLNGNPNNSPLVRNASTGMLYGIDPYGGPNSTGIIYQVDPTTNVLTVITTLQSTGPQIPLQLVIDSSGNLFGITQVSTAGGGTLEGGNGELFELPAGNFATPIVLYTFNTASFSDDPDGTDPGAMLIDSNNNIDVLTGLGGANNGGNVDQFLPGEGYATPHVLGTMPSSYLDGVASFALAPSGAFFISTTADGANGAGGLSELEPGQSTATLLASFDNATGGSAGGLMYVDAQGDVFGTTELGGSGGEGGVWEYNSTTQQLSQIAAFGGANTGAAPVDGVIADSSGNLYGTTTQGLSGGTFFKVAAGTHAVSFTNVGTTATGTEPFGAPCPDGNGNFFLTTVTGAANNAGAVVEISPGGGGGGGGGGTATGVTPAVTKDTVPTAVVGGAKLHGALAVSLENSGSAVEKGYTVNVYASSDTTLDTSTDTLVTSTTKTPTINAGKTGKLNIPITEISSALDGSYYLIVETVDSSSNTASAASNSTVEVAPPFVTLTETLTTTLPAALVSDSAAKGSVILSITNSGNVASKGVTPITVTASTTSGVVGTTIATVTPPKNLNILPGKTVKVTIPIKTIPALPSDNYFLVAQTIDPFAGGVSIASSASTIDIAAGFIQLSGTLGPASLKTGDILTVTNNGNVPDTATSLTGTLGFSLDAAGAVPVGSTLPGTVKTPKIAVGKSAKIHLTAWSSILSSLTSGVPYYLTVTFDDGNGGTVLAVSTTTFTL